MEPDYYRARSLWSSIHKDLITIHTLTHNNSSESSWHYFHEGVRYCLLGRDIVRQITTYNDGTSSDTRARALVKTLQPFVAPCDQLELEMLLYRVVAYALVFRDLLNKVFGWWVMFYRHPNVVIAGTSLIEADALHCGLPAVVKIRAGRPCYLICAARGGACSVRVD